MIIYLLRETLHAIDRIRFFRATILLTQSDDSQISIRVCHLNEQPIRKKTNESSKILMKTNGSL